jgi:hypothetical protein
MMGQYNLLNASAQFLNFGDHGFVYGHPKLLHFTANIAL